MCHSVPSARSSAITCRAGAMWCVVAHGDERQCAHISVGTVTPVEMRATCVPWRTLDGTVALKILRLFFLFFFSFVSL